MTELRVHYWPATPNMRELKFYVNNKLELSVFVDYITAVSLRNELHKATQDMLKDNNEPN